MKILFTIDDTITITGMSRSSIYKAQKMGILQFRKVMGRTVITKDDLDAFVAGLPVVPVQSKPLPHRRVMA